MHSSLLGGGHEVHGHLVEVGEELVLLHVYAAVVAHCDSGLVVSEYLVLLYLGERRARAYDACPLVLVDLVVAHVNAGVEHDYAILVIVDVVVFDPTKPSFDAENALTP